MDAPSGKRNEIEYVGLLHRSIYFPLSKGTRELVSPFNSRLRELNGYTK